MNKKIASSRIISVDDQWDVFKALHEHNCMNTEIELLLKNNS